MIEKLFCILGAILILALLAYGITLISPELTQIIVTLPEIDNNTIQTIINITR